MKQNNNHGLLLVERQRLHLVDGLHGGKHVLLHGVGVASGCLVSVRLFTLSWLSLFDKVAD